MIDWGFIAVLFIAFSSSGCIAFIVLQQRAEEERVRHEKRERHEEDEYRRAVAAYLTACHTPHLYQPPERPALPERPEPVWPDLEVGRGQ